MLFNSYVFLFVFLPVVLAVFAFLRRYPERRWAIGWLVLASLVYYAWWRPAFVLLIVASTLVNYGFGRLLLGGGLSRVAARIVLIAGLAFNLGVLGYFKYAMFLVRNANDLFGAGWAVPEIILPIGISFITFQKIAFLVDAYRGKVQHLSLPNFALFVTFFPQLIAGPIVHHSEVMPQFAHASARNRAEDLAVGLSIFCIGLFKKVVVADACAVYADAGYEALKSGQPIAAAFAWIAVIAFSFQLYYDFSGYSDMAIGLARMFGVSFPANFHSPYKATGIVDFWRRWHITLSRFLRDYLYIPLGGGRRGPLRRYLNLAITMLLGGLWHGANWTFVVWGGLHGVLLGVNHAWKQTRFSTHALWDTPRGKAYSVFLTFLTVTLLWIPFRAENLGDAQRMLGALFNAAPDGSFRLLLNLHFLELESAFDFDQWFVARELWNTGSPLLYVTSSRPAGLLLALVAIATFTLPNTQQLFARYQPVLNLPPAELEHRHSLPGLNWKVAAALGGAFVLCVLNLARVSPFLYYQF